ncbi:integrin alpha [Solwaraspora sp. WMMD1047]|uniref:integrin alpha n=1 Tax=Solwaraspora sp. WMMD1047 TaxID=3016102 RepID=UPI00241779A7|nr:integrin alpha [Solwaraspora sp. WMMD1047]MDG4832853.1 integrin alpha [Solwaraspora sp. WMMD1047]
MKLARGIRLTAAGAAALLGILASSASAATAPPPLPDPTRTAAGESGPSAAGPAPDARPGRPATATQEPAGRPPAVRGPAAAQAGQPAAAERAPARFDLDGDGRDELVVGTTVEQLGRALHVRYSSRSAAQTLTAPTGSYPDWRFQLEFTSGDFDGDGIGDLAVAAVRTVSSTVFEHGLFVYEGGPAGLDRAGVRLLTGLTVGALAAGDVDGDGRDDLAVSDGSANVAGHPPFRGSVTVLRGGADGLTRTGEIVVRQVLAGWSGLVEEYFGGSLAIGDFTGDGYGDLAVGGFRRGARESDVHGMVTLFPGSAGGPDPTRASKVEGQFELTGSLPVDVLAMADLNLDGRSDLVLGLPRYGSGEIVYLPGAAAGLSAAGHRRINQDTPGVPGESDQDSTGGGFGFSLATGDATGDGVPDLLVGANTMSVGSVPDAGAVYLLPGTANGPTGAGSYAYRQGAAPAGGRKPNPHHLDRAEENDYLGASAALLDLDGVGPLEIFVGSAHEDLSEAPSGTSIGLLTELRLDRDPPRRGEPARPALVRLAAVTLYRPADLPVAGGRISRIGPGLLAG